MPTLPLFVSPVDVDASHRVFAPGGGEWWRFDAIDPSRDLRLIVELLCGDPLDANYVRRYWRYRKQPTRVAPPTPGEFIVARVKTFRGEEERTCEVRIESQQVSASSEKLDVSFGPVRAIATDERIILSLQPRADSPCHVSGELTFTPVFQVGRVAIQIAEHQFWMLANPVCTVRGELRIDGTLIDFTGRGWREHLFGTRPLGENFQSLLRGRITLEDRCLAFTRTIGGKSISHRNSRIVEIDERGVREVPGEVSFLPIDAGAEPLLYPDQIRIGELATLTDPKVIAVTNATALVDYAADAFGSRTIGNCELIVAPR